MATISDNDDYDYEHLFRFAHEPFYDYLTRILDFDEDELAILLEDEENTPETIVSEAILESLDDVWRIVCSFTQKMSCSCIDPSGSLAKHFLKPLICEITSTDVQSAYKLQHDVDIISTLIKLLDVDTNECWVAIDKFLTAYLKFSHDEQTKNDDTAKKHQGNTIKYKESLKQYVHNVYSPILNNELMLALNTLYQYVEQESNTSFFDNPIFDEPTNESIQPFFDHIVNLFRFIVFNKRSILAWSIDYTVGFSYFHFFQHIVLCYFQLCAGDSSTNHAQQVYYRLNTSFGILTQQISNQIVEIIKSQQLQEQYDYCLTFNNIQQEQECQGLLVSSFDYVLLPAPLQYFEYNNTDATSDEDLLFTTTTPLDSWLTLLDSIIIFLCTPFLAHIEMMRGDCIDDDYNEYYVHPQSIFRLLQKLLGNHVNYQIQYNNRQQHHIPAYYIPLIKQDTILVILRWLSSFFYHSTLQFEDGSHHKYGYMHYNRFFQVEYLAMVLWNNPIVHQKELQHRPSHENDLLFSSVLFSHLGYYSEFELSAWQKVLSKGYDETSTPRSPSDYFFDSCGSKFCQLLYLIIQCQQPSKTIPNDNYTPCYRPANDNANNSNNYDNTSKLIQQCDIKTTYNNTVVDNDNHLENTTTQKIILYVLIFMVWTKIYEHDVRTEDINSILSLQYCLEYYQCRKKHNNNTTNNTNNNNNSNNYNNIHDDDDVIIITTIQAICAVSRQLLEMYSAINE